MTACPQQPVRSLCEGRAAAHQMSHEYIVCIIAVSWLVLDCLLLPVSRVSAGILLCEGLLLQAAAKHIQVQARLPGVPYLYVLHSLTVKPGSMASMQHLPLTASLGSAQRRCFVSLLTSSQCNLGFRSKTHLHSGSSCHSLCHIVLLVDHVPVG